MFGNWIECTHNGTGGSGTLTLAPVTGAPQFTDVFGASGTRLVSYVINEFTDATRAQLSKTEAGIGSLVLSTNVLTRSKRSASWDGTTYDNTSPAAVSFGNSAANIRILCAPLADSFVPTMPFFCTDGLLADDFGLLSANITIPGSSAFTLNQDSEYYVPFLWIGRGEVSQVGVRVQTAVASGGIKCSIYDLASTGLPGERIKDVTSGGAFDASSTGNKVISTTGLNVPPGWYYVALISNSSSISVRAGSGSYGSPTPLGASFGAHLLYAYKTSQSYSTGLPATAHTGLTGDYTVSPPFVYWKPAN